jgi:Mor family transcriptional regulator
VLFPAKGLNVTDFLDDMKSRLVVQLHQIGITPETAGMIAATLLDSIKTDYEGERVYISRSSEVTLCQMTARNRSIIRDWKAGERVALLARRYGISRIRVYQIVNGL